MFVRGVIIPFMQETYSKILVFNCTTVYHNKMIYKTLRDPGIEPYPSGIRPFDVEGGYTSNSHDWVPNELINENLKENARVSFQKLGNVAEQWSLCRRTSPNRRQSLTRSSYATVLANYRRLLGPLERIKGAERSIEMVFLLCTFLSFLSFHFYFYQTLEQQTIGKFFPTHGT